MGRLVGTPPDGGVTAGSNRDLFSSYRSEIDALPQRIRDAVLNASGEVKIKKLDKQEKPLRVL
jgi:hypothetical protein